MKKIFAIALALVMVLSMASAFASQCTAGFDWNKAAVSTNCGKGSIEVVPYVRVNTACAPYYDFEVSTCAGAVAGEKVYYAVKLTVDANADDEWWADAEVEMTYKGVTSTYGVASPVWATLKADIAAEETEAKANEFYYNFATRAWELVDKEFEFGGNNLDAALVTKPSVAKVCATLKSGDKDFVEGVVGDYYVRYFPAVAGTAGEEVTYVPTVAKLKDWGIITAAEKAAYGTDAEVTAKVDALIKEATVTYTVGGSDGFYATLEVYTKDPAKGGELLVWYVINDDDEVMLVEYSKVCGADAYATIKAFFGLEIGTTVTQKLVNANFGWKDKIESCFSWSDKVQAIVDAECVVAIPKTGDASVLAWLF